MLKEKEAELLASKASSPEQTDALPMSILNPDLLERTRLEEEELKSGGDLSAAFRRTCSEGDSYHIPIERIKEMIEVEKRRHEAGMDEPDSTGDEIKVIFRTADALEELNG